MQPLTFAMMHSGPSFPFFVPTPPRPLSEAEGAIMGRLLAGQERRYAEQLGDLRVVGRCGCGVCPTVFFLPHREADRESDLVTMAGKDRSGGLVAAVLLEKEGRLSQLEFYPVDGHDPWEVPAADALAPW